MLLFDGSVSLPPPHMTSFSVDAPLIIDHDAATPDEPQLNALPEGSDELRTQSLDAVKSVNRPSIPISFLLYANQLHPQYVPRTCRPSNLNARPQLCLIRRQGLWVT